MALQMNHTNKWDDFREPIPPAPERRSAEPEPYTPFPLDALPPVIADFAAAVGSTICVDPVCAVLPMLSMPNMFLILKF